VEKTGPVLLDLFSIVVRLKEFESFRQQLGKFEGSRDLCTRDTQASQLKILES
jgi:hypothetical protein